MRIQLMYLHILLALWLTISPSEGAEIVPTTILQNANGDKNTEILVVNHVTAYVGGTNYFHIIPLDNDSSTENAKRVNFSSAAKNVNDCKNYRPDLSCENTVRLLEVMHDGRLLVCGTNAGNPHCVYINSTTYSSTDAKLDAKRWLSEEPTVSTTSLLLGNNNTDAELYVGSTKSSSGVFWKKIPETLKSVTGWLSDPEFTGTYSLGQNKEMIYVFFNEKSSNFVNEKFDVTNKKEDYYSTVARLCRSDRGGSVRDSDTWMTFNKARLICPWPGSNIDGSQNLFYDEIVSTYSSGNSVYGIFRTNRKWKLTSYAICVFSAEAIDATMEGKLFESNQTEYIHASNPDESIVFSAAGSWEPPFTPGTCPESTNYVLKSDFEKFLMTNTLVKMNVLPTGGKPFYVGNDDEMFAFILVQTIPTAKILYLLSNNGIFKKMKLFPDLSTNTLFQQQISLDGSRILSAKLIKDGNFIFASLEDSIISFPTHFCQNYTDCPSCSADPHCEWKTNATSPHFYCTIADNFDQRTCSKTPDTPKNATTKLLKDAVEITWSVRGEEIASLVKISQRKLNVSSAFYSEINYANKITVPRSDLTDGTVYKVIIQAINQSTLSDEAFIEFSTDLKIPQIVINMLKDGLVAITWQRISGAQRYIVKLFDGVGKLLEEFIIFPSSNHLYFHFSNIISGYKYTVSVAALSEDGLMSTDKKDFTFQDEPHVATMGCSSISSALAVVTALLFIPVAILLYNNWVMKPCANILKDEKNECFYIRRYLVIWQKRTVSKIHADNYKFQEEEVVSSTNA